MLGLWEYFWTWNDTPVPAQSSSLASAGSGKSSFEYKTLDDEYWHEYTAQYKPPKSVLSETIEERHQRLFSEIRKIAMEQQQLEDMKNEYQFAYLALPTVTSSQELKALTSYIANLRQEIEQLEETNKDRIIRAKQLRISLYFQ